MHTHNMNRTPLLIVALFSLCLCARAQQVQQTDGGAPGIGGSGEGYKLEGSGTVQQQSAADAAAAAEAEAVEKAEKSVHYIGGPETQAGDPNASDAPVQKVVVKQGSGSSSSSSGSSSAPGNSDIVAQARAFIKNPPYNSNNGSHDWNGWCLGFVNTTLKASGHAVSIMYQPAAKDAYYAMAKAGRVSQDRKSIPAGAPLFWIGCSQWGHAAVATGEMSTDGTPVMVTTSGKGIREMSTGSFGCGWPTGWGKL